MKQDGRLKFIVLRTADITETWQQSKYWRKLHDRLKNLTVKQKEEIYEPSTL